MGTVWHIGWTIPVLTLAFPGPVEIPPGFELLEIRQTDLQIGFSRLNNCGQIVFPEDFVGDRNMDIVLYDNGVFTRITDTPDEPDRCPDIGESGTIVWNIDGGFQPQRSELRILRDGEERSLGLGENPVINRAGRIAWTRIVDPNTCRFESHIDFFDGEQTRQITGGNLSNQDDTLNDFDELAWTEFSFCESPWMSNIMFYTGGESFIVNEERHQWQGTVVNNLGQIIYTGPPGLFLWEGGETTRIFDATCCGDINNLGDVCHNFQEDHRQGDMYVLKVVGGKRITYRITEDPISEFRCNMNDWGEVAWTTRNNETWAHGLRFLRRIRTGDSEFDGDIDVDDLAKLVDCMTGPMWVERANPGPEDSLCECRFLDINHDGSVDLRDYTIFQQNFAKP